MFRSFIAFIVAFAIAFAGIVKPAYAASNYPGTMSSDYPAIINNRGDNNPIYFNNSFNSSDDRKTTEESSEAFLNGAVNGFVTTAGVVVGGAVACYALDGIATAFFPPAAALAAFCPGVGATAGGASAFVKAR